MLGSVTEGSRPGLPPARRVGPRPADPLAGDWHARQRAGFAAVRNGAARNAPADPRCGRPLALEVSRDLLEFSRNPSSRGRPVTPTWFPLAPYLIRLADEQRVEADARLTLHVDLTAVDSVEVFCDRVPAGPAAE